MGIFKDLPTATEPVAAALAACRRHFVAVIGFSALLNLLFVVPMLYMLQVYDRVVPTRGGVTLLLLTLVLLFALLTLSLLDLVRSRLLVRAGIRLDRMLAGVLLDTSLARSDRGYDSIARQSMREFDMLRQALTGPAILALADFPWAPIYVLIAFLIHPWLGVLILVGSVALFLIALRNERASSEPLMRANEAAGRAYASQEQVLASAENVRALGMRRAMVARHLAERGSMLSLQTDASFAASRYVTLSKFVRLSLQSLSLGLGGWLAITDEISAGAIFVASYLAGRALQPIEQLLSSWQIIGRGRAAYASINDALAGGGVERPLTQLPNPTGRIAVEGLSVSNGADALVLSGVSFTVEPGEIVAVVGPSGAGKSTLLRTMAGAIGPQDGVIRFDGASMAAWDPERLAKFIGYLPQEVSLFGGTVKENIARFETELAGDPVAVDARAVKAAQDCAAHEMIVRLPNGYDASLGRGGSGLSAGQAQRVGLARALYGDPPIILLDEPNAHLDSDGEAALVTTLAALKARGAGVLVVSHRRGVLSAVDKILVLRDGRVELFGPRDAVLAKLQAPPSVVSIRPSGRVVSKGVSQ